MTDQSAAQPAYKPKLGRPPSMDNPRDQILNHAARLFADKGFEACSLRDLSVAAGLSKPAIYNYYDSKQAVYDAIILRTLKRLAEDSRRAVDPEADPTVQLRAFMRAHAQSFEDQYEGFVATLIGFSGMSQGLRNEAQQFRDEHEHRLRGIIARGVSLGVFRPTDPETVGRAVLSMLNWMARWFKPGAGKTATEVADGYFNLIASGLNAPVMLGVSWW